MCTVTVVPHDGGFRMMCNRDERHERPAALPPRRCVLGGRPAIFPIDPQGQGSWIGLNGAGLAVALLNLTPDGVSPQRPPLRSRGLIVPHLLRRGGLFEALDAAIELECRWFAPFRAIVLHNAQVGVVSSDGARLTIDATRLTRPLLFTSSSLGDARVLEPRRRLFEDVMQCPPAAWLNAQRRFHLHQWPARPEISVLMERGDARTVSRTTVDATPRRRHLVYEPLLADDSAAVPVGAEAVTSRAWDEALAASCQ